MCPTSCKFFPAIIVGIALSLHVAASNAAEPSQRQYQAQWIWAKVESPKPFQFVKFRKTVELAARPENATAFITADTFYRLWINDQLVMHGPARSSRGKCTVDPVEVGQYLVQGKNTASNRGLPRHLSLRSLSPIARHVLRTNHQRRRKANRRGRHRRRLGSSRNHRLEPRFSAFQLSTRLDGAIQRAASAAREVAAGNRLRPGGHGPLEKRLPPRYSLACASATCEAHGGRSGSTVAMGSSATSIRSNDSNLPRPQWDEQSKWFRRLETEHLKADAAAADNPSGVTGKGTGDTILKGDSASISYDLGRGYVGFLGFEVTGHEGQVLELVWNERQAADGGVRPRAQTGNNAVRYTLREGRQSFLAFMPQFARFVRVVQRGEGQITLHRSPLDRVPLPPRRRTAISHAPTTASIGYTKPRAGRPP